MKGTATVPCECNPASVVLCRVCNAQNLSWSMACWECGADLDTGEPARFEDAEKAGAA